MALRAPVPHVADDGAELVRRIRARDQSAFEALMRQDNGRLFRVARAVLRNDAEAEDALQDAYLDVYRHIASFRGGAALATWLTRIVLNHALMRLRRHRHERNVVSFPDGRPDGPPAGAEVPDEMAEPAPHALARAEMRRLLERRIDELPVAFRTVFVLREVEDMTVEETARCLAIPAATVRTRLFRARALLREALARDLDLAARDVFSFAGARCDRTVAAVLARLAGS